jgi:hypothetical protein
LSYSSAISTRPTRSRVVTVPARPTRSRVVTVPAGPARSRVVTVPVVVPARAAIPASGSPSPASGSSLPVVAAAPIPVIAPARVPELSWAPLREGPWLSLRLGCGAHAGQAQGDGYSEYGCNKTCKRCKGFHVYP